MEFLTNVAAGIVATLTVLTATAALSLIAAIGWKWRLLPAVWRLRRNGLSNFFVNRSEYITRRRKTINEYIEGAEQGFVYVGNYFSAATDQSNVTQSLQKLLNSGKSVCVVLLDESSPSNVIDYLEAHYGIAAQTLKGRLSNAKSHFLKFRTALSPDQQKRFEIRLHQMPLASSAFLIDAGTKRAAVLIDTKWFHAGRDQSFGLEFEGHPQDGTMFRTAIDAFTEIKDAATLI